MRPALSQVVGSRRQLGDGDFPVDLSGRLVVLARSPAWRVVKIEPEFILMLSPCALLGGVMADLAGVRDPTSQAVEVVRNGPSVGLLVLVGADG